MMVVYENECIDCPSELGCFGISCTKRNVLHMTCDKCKEEVDELYETENGQLCADCVLGMFEKVRID